MNIFFENEVGTVFAVAYDVIIDDYLYKELLIAEIDNAMGSFMVRFESDWNNPVICSSLDEAQQHVIKNHHKYKGTSIGKNYYVGE